MRRIDVDLGARLRAVRLARGFTISQVARLLDCSRSNVSQLERGQQNPTIKQLLTCADFYQCSVDALIRGKLPLRPSPRLPARSRVGV